MVFIPYIAATLLYHSKIQLLHRKSEVVAIAEGKVWKVPQSKHFPEGIKYSLFLVLKETGDVLVGFDNHKPKGHHRHRRGREEEYDFESIDSLVEEFWYLVEQEGFLI